MTQEQIKRSELTFRVIVEPTPNVIVLVNKEGKISYVNNQPKKLLRYSSIELVGQMVERLIPKQYLENHSVSGSKFYFTTSNLNQ